jgi:hypothetical protein
MPAGGGIHRISSLQSNWNASPGRKAKGDEGAAPRCLFFLLTIGPPPPHKGRNSGIRAREAKTDEIGMLLL